MVASAHMILPLPRGLRVPVLLILVAGASALLAPGRAPAAETVAAIRGIPSSLSARYQRAIPLGTAGPGRYLIPTRTGFEIREASQASGDSLVATFRTEGRIDEAALSGTTVWLAAGSRGLLAVDLGVSADPVFSGSYVGLGTIRHVAVSTASGTVAAASDSALFLFRETGGASLSPLATHRWTDGRKVQRVLARNDSLLVAAQRPGRIFLVLFRVPAGAPAESLWDFQANGPQMQDVAWQGATAYLADGDNGILPFHLPTQQLRPATPISGNRFVLSLDADDSLLVAVGGGKVFARFLRGGVFGDSLTSESDITLPLNPTWVRLVGSHAIISSDSGIDQPDPDEVGRSVVQDHDLSTGVTGAPVGATGRVRRVVRDGGLAYVADYTGGLRIYRGDSNDSSLVGVLPPTGSAGTYDLALDPARRLLYLASGAAGVEVVDVSDSTAPARIATIPATGPARCVAVIGDSLVAAGWVPFASGMGGVTFFDVASASAPFPRGSISSGPLLTTIKDPRSLAARDTVLFVADALSGVISVMFGNPDTPAIPGAASGVLGTRDLDLLGTRLLEASGSGIRVVDASVPTFLVQVGPDLPLPPVYGVTQQGNAAVAFLGEEGAVVIDLSNPALPVLRGSIRTPGFPRDGAWSGDALLVASSYGLERFTLPGSLPQESPLALSYDAAGTLPRVTASWPPVSLTGIAGLNLYRESLAAGGALGSGPGRVNGSLLAPSAVTFADGSLPSPGTFRYRLEAAFADGSAREIAVGTIFVRSTTRVGRPYPNPFRPSSSGLLSIPFRSQPASAASFRVRIYDVRGRLVRSMTGPAPTAGGFNSVPWNGRDDRGVPVASGFYLVHVRAPGIDDARSVVLLR